MRMAVAVERQAVTAPRALFQTEWPGERAVLVVLAIIQVVLRALCVVHHHIDSDEPQHLHVIWGWNHGLVQYRDLFDNHAPLFHLALMPAMRLLGERPDIIAIGRMLMLPMVALTLWATWRVGRALWSSRAGA